MTPALLRRVRWSLWERVILQRQVRGFSASAFSHCSGSCAFGEYSRIYRDCVLVDVQLGRFSYVNQGTRVRLAGIGNFCSIGQDARIGGLGRHPLHVSTHPAFFSASPPGGLSMHALPGFRDFDQVRIGHDVWVGDRAMVLGGISIGSGAIVAANSTVTRDVGPYEIVAGSPARLVRHRVPEQLIPRMLATQWWSWDIQKLQRHGALIGSDRLEEFLERSADE
jgi:acetyltransferase-like isoleucine patch superfamily enzyme